MYEAANVHKIENDCTSKFHEVKTEILTCQEKRKTTFTWKKSNFLTKET